MAKDPEPASGNTGKISTGSVKGSALSTGHRNTQTVTYTRTASAADDRAAVLEALREIRAALEGISGSYSKTAKRNADAAFAAASAEKLDKDEVGGALESALEAAKKSAEFIGVAATLGPYVKTAAGWLGDEWSHLIGLLG